MDKDPLQSLLVNGHKNKLATLGDGVYFACTNLKTTDETIYDLGFIIRLWEKAWS